MAFNWLEGSGDSGVQSDTFTSDNGSGDESELCVENEKYDSSNKISDKPIKFERIEDCKECEQMNFEEELFVNKQQTTKFKSVNNLSKSKSVPSIKFETNETHSKPKRTKSVIFADSEGMELTKIFYFKPISIFSSNDSEIEVFTNFGTNNEVNKQIQFTTNFKSDSKQTTSLRANMVALETISVDENAIKGRIRVLNKEYRKEVLVRWTQDDWLNTNQSEASYQSSLKSVFVDVFVFNIPVKICRTEFAILYLAGGQEYWDNNNNNNYSVDCYFT